MLYFLHFSLSSFYVPQRVNWFPFFLVLAFFLCKLQSSLQVFPRFLENTTYCKPLFEQHQFYCAVNRVNIGRDNLTHLNITAPSATVPQAVNYVTTQTELPNKIMIILDDDCRFMTCFDVLSCDEIFSSCHDFQIHPSYSNWFENGLRACIITLIWTLFACFLWNQMKQFLKYDFLISPASLLKSLFCMLTCEGLFNDQFRKYEFF